jgi:hypothetical protein
LSDGTVARQSGRSRSELDSQSHFAILGGDVFMTRLRQLGEGTPFVRYLDWVAAIVVTLSAAYFHALFFLNAGGLWRDEAGLVHLSLLPSLSEVWQKLPHDSFPFLVPLAVRAWSAVGLGNTDLGLRVLGLLAGLFLLLAFWVISWTMRNGTPLLAVTLAGLNVTIVRVGDSVRGYGLGSALAVLTLAVIWRLAWRPSLTAFFCAVAVAILSVQSLYQNAVFLFAACCGGFVVCAVERRWRDMLPVFGVGAAAAVSLLPYIPLIIGVQDWSIITRYGFDFSIGWQQLAQAMASPLPVFTWVWVALWIGAVATSMFVLLWRRARLPDRVRSVILFAGTSLVLAAAGYAVFLKLNALPTLPRYYVPLLVLSAVCLDAVLFTVSGWARPAAMILAVLAISTTFLFELPAVKCRETNVDLVAAKLSSEVVPNDFVIVYPWYCGVTFERYYKAAAPWTTFPPLEDHGMHRFDLLKAEMQKKDAIAPVIDRITSTLQSGNRVWFVGNLSAGAWFSAGAKVRRLISAHSQQSAVVVDPSTNCVNPLENPPVFVATGWKP